MGVTAGMQKFRKSLDDVHFVLSRPFSASRNGGARPLARGYRQTPCTLPCGRQRGLVPRGLVQCMDFHKMRLRHGWIRVAVSSLA